MKKKPQTRKASPRALKTVYCTLKKLNVEGAKKYALVERDTGIVLAYDTSIHINPAHDAFLKGYNLFKNQAVLCESYCINHQKICIVCEI